MRVRKKQIGITLLMMAVSCLFFACTIQKNSEIGEEENVTAHLEEDKTKDAGINFPYTLDEGRILVNSVFPSSVMNPDCNDKYGEDIATVELENNSGKFLKEAMIMVKLADGTEIPFVITNVPDGKKIWAFATDNESIELTPICEMISCEVTYEENMSLTEKEMSYQSDGTKVTLENMTEKKLKDISIGCHCLFDDVYYGGLTYYREIDELNGKESITVAIDECYLGSAELVSLAANKEE